MSRRSVLSLAVCLFLAFGIVGFSGCGHRGPVAEPKSKVGDVDALIQSLSDPTPNARSLAALNLGRLGAAADQAVPKLQELANSDPDEKVRNHARNALQKIQGN